MKLIDQLKSEITFSYSRSSGPGGQNVNKVSTKVSLRLKLLVSEFLSEAQKERLVNSSLKRYITKNGELLMHCEETSNREMNKQKLIQKFARALEKGLSVPKKRVATKPTKGSKERRLKDKKVQKGIKLQRRSATNTSGDGY